METYFKNIADFKDAITSDTDLQNAFKTDPAEAAKSIQETPPLDTDKWIYRIVVIALGVSILSIIVGMLILIGYAHFKDDQHVPTIFTAIGSAAIGALSGLLAPSPKKQ